MKMRTATLLLLACVLAGAARRSQNPADLVVEYAKFKEPPGEYRGHRWFGFRLSNITESSIVNGLQQSAKSDSYGNLMIGPAGGLTTGLSEAYMKNSRRPPSLTGVAYLSEEYFRLYRLAIEEGLKNNLPLRVLYDELQYPSGMAGGLLYSKYPESAAKSLEMVEKNVTGPAAVTLEIPVAGGMYVVAVMMHRDTLERVDISAHKPVANRFTCQVPKGEWKVMLFY